MATAKDSPPEAGGSVEREVSVAASAENIRLRKEQEELEKLRAKLHKRKLDFRVYLEQTGIIDKLSKALTLMFEEPVLPEDPIGYFKKLIATEDFDPEVEQLDALSQEVKELKGEIAGLVDENKKLRTALGMPVELMQSNAVKLVPSESEPPTGNLGGVPIRDKNAAAQQPPVRTPSANMKKREKKA